ncbi:MAG: hypothetical protein IKZ25_02495 [Clostridia bacterium]|nr:hypothetical protein [Clostridia bacterium]
MKKIISLILILTIVLSIAGCAYQPKAEKGELLNEGNIEKVELMLMPEMSTYTAEGKDAQALIDCVEELELTTEYSTDPNMYDAKAWILTFNYSNGETLKINLFGNKFVRLAGKDWFEIPEELGNKFETAIQNIIK